LGHQVKTLSWKEMKKTGLDCDVPNMRTPPLFSQKVLHSLAKLARPRITVRRILAPMGANFPHQITESWPESDWIYNYGTYAHRTIMLEQETVVATETVLLALQEQFKDVEGKCDAPLLLLD